MRASTAKQVLPTSGGSFTSCPSTRPPPPWPEVRQPPPWPQPPSSFCCWTSQVRPFLTLSLSGLGLTAVAIGGASALGGAAGGSAFLSVAFRPVSRHRTPKMADREASRYLA